MRELRSHLGRHQATPMDAEAEKRAGWRAARHPGRSPSMIRA